MTRILAVLLSIAVGSVAFAQEDIEVTTLDPVDPNAVVEEELPEEKAQIPTVSIDQAVLRGIDKLDGIANDMIVWNAFPRQFGLLEIRVKECRYPEDNPSGEAFAYLTIKEADATIFAGWMIASSPALNALDHQRYDVWLLRCRVSSTEGATE